ncbi:peroxisome assembly protein 12-like [Drosophila pseudoobscura]|uniref:Peroxisome assembly protein 12 n=1 Tax=Drosophila pseudoobscura pseudoobscura TaxID=46245 RepID=A0A6I8W5I2_DROPS|nr:peroxisome assembly protein 12-like [Drosophila pseudoobscura]
MAEAANVRQNLQNVPSIFEISAAETLDNLIYPALSKIFDYFGLRLDFKLWGNLRVREELSPLLTWILQYLYLRNRASSFGESFYGLQRTATGTGELSRLTLRYPSEPPQEDKWTYIFLKMLEVLAFFLQFIQWWYSNDQRRKVGGTLQNPEAMQKRDLPEEVKQTLPQIGKCPICLLPLQTPTACSVSGYVFCWKCIISHMKEHGTCPVTSYPISLDDLVRIYET